MRLACGARARLLTETGCGLDVYVPHRCRSQYVHHTHTHKQKNNRWPMALSHKRRAYAKKCSVVHEMRTHAAPVAQRRDCAHCNCTCASTPKQTYHILPSCGKCFVGQSKLYIDRNHRCTAAHNRLACTNESLTKKELTLCEREGQRQRRRRHR